MGWTSTVLQLEVQVGPWVFWVQFDILCSLNSYGYVHSIKKKVLIARVPITRKARNTLCISTSELLSKFPNLGCLNSKLSTTPPMPHTTLPMQPHYHTSSIE